MRTMGELNRKM